MSLSGRKSNITKVPQKIYEGVQIRNNLGILIFASEDNTEKLWLGFSPNITAGTNDETDGFPLSPGKTLELEIRDPENIYIRSTESNSQKIYFIMI